MIAALLSFIVSSVSLTLDDASKYFYTEIVNTNLLTNVGMGGTYSSKDPLRYTDIAFLNEAYAERATIYDAIVQSRREVENKIDTSDIRFDDLYDTIFNWGEISGKGFAPYGFFNAKISDARTDIFIPTYKLYSPNFYHVYIDIFNGTNNFSVCSNTNLSNCIGIGGKLLAENVACAYADLAKTKVFGANRYYNMRTTEIVSGHEKMDSTSYPETWSDTDEGWIYGTLNSTPISGTLHGQGVSYQNIGKAIKVKKVHWDYDAFEQKYIHTDVVSGHRTEGRFADTYEDGDFTIPIDNSYSVQKVSEIYKISIYAVGFVACDETIRKDGIVVYSRSTNTTYVAHVPGGIYGAVDNSIYITQGTILDSSTKRNIFAAVGFTEKSDGQVLDLCEEPDDPDVSSIDAYEEKETSASVSYYISVENFIILFEFRWWADIVN